METLTWIAETLRVLLEGGGWAELKATRGFQMLVGAAAWLVPSSLIALGIGMTEWRETPLALFLGFRPQAPDADWAERARDLDKDGLPDF